MAPACMTSILHDKESNPDTYREEGAERLLHISGFAI